MTSKPRILFFTPTSSGIGGVETWLDKTWHHLSSRGWDPIVGLARGAMHNRPELFREFHPGLETIEVDGRGLNQEGRIRAVMRCIKRVKPDVVAPLGVYDAYPATVRMKQRQPDLRLVLRNQGFLPAQLADIRTYGPASDGVASAGRLAIRFAVQVASVAPNRTWHIPNGAELPNAVQRESNPCQALRLGYVGRFTRHDKRVLDAIAFCHQMHERGVAFTFDFVGDGPCREELQAGLEDLVRQGNVRFHGRLQHEVLMRDIYPQLDCMLLFSSSESFGIVLVEAMACGVVPVTSRYLGFNTERLVEDEIHGLSFPVGDVSAAVSQVVRLDQDRQLLRRLSTAGANQVKSNYTWQRCLESWEQLFEAVLEMPAVPYADVARRGQKSGRLDRLGIPPAIIDLSRRIRRSLCGPAVLPGGEEWPFHGTAYDSGTLNQFAKDASVLDEQSIERPGVLLSLDPHDA